MLQPMADVTKAQWCHILKCLHQNKTVSVSSLDGLIFSYKYLATAQHCPGTKHWLEFLRHEKHFKKKKKKKRNKQSKKPTIFFFTCYIVPSTMFHMSALNFLNFKVDNWSYTACERNKCLINLEERWDQQEPLKFIQKLVQKYFRV